MDRHAHIKQEMLDYFANAIRLGMTLSDVPEDEWRTIEAGSPATFGWMWPIDVWDDNPEHDVDDGTDTTTIVVPLCIERIARCCDNLDDEELNLFLWILKLILSTHVALSDMPVSEREEIAQARLREDLEHSDEAAAFWDAQMFHILDVVGA